MYVCMYAYMLSMYVSRHKYSMNALAYEWFSRLHTPLLTITLV